jgi:hypothetical protein
MLCVGGGAGGGPLGNAPEVAFLMMSAACSNVSVRMTKASQLYHIPQLGDDLQG